MIDETVRRPAPACPGHGSGTGARRVEQRRRIGSYGLCRDERGVLLVRASETSDCPGVWQIPGGGLEHGEHPEAALLREFAEETGLAIRVTGVRAVVSDVTRLPDLDVAVHT